ncbi:hypothetical protein Tco_0842211 [Tanacetum coccineum]|uniref:Uncharacterized protein n=1 Tax=Tanacetum coccineum TaxID=301880 RepID=A0ABQ5B4A1_9ASTR
MNHPSRFSTCSPLFIHSWIYMAQFATLKEDGSKVSLRFRLDQCGLCGVLEGLTIRFISNFFVPIIDFTKISAVTDMALSFADIQDEGHKNKVGMQIPAWMITDEMKLTEHYRIHEEQEARENVALVDEHLASEEIEKMVDGQENIVDDSLIPRNDEPNIPGTRIEPRSNKESPKVELTKETLVVEITNVVIPVNVNDDDEEITDEVYELKIREKWKLL